MMMTSLLVKRHVAHSLVMRAAGTLRAQSSPTPNGKSPEPLRQAPEMLQDVSLQTVILKLALIRKKYTMNIQYVT